MTEAPWNLKTHKMDKSTKTVTLSIDDFTRAANCVNALIGIENPVAFITEQKEILDANNKIHEEYQAQIQRLKDTNDKTQEQFQTALNQGKSAIEQRDKAIDLTKEADKQIGEMKKQIEELQLELRKKSE